MAKILFLLLFEVIFDWFLSLFVYFNCHFREIVVLLLFLLLSSSFFLDILILFPLLNISFWFIFPFLAILLIFFISNGLENWFLEGNEYFLLPVIKYFDRLIDGRVSMPIQSLFFLTEHTFLRRLLNLFHHFNLRSLPFFFNLLNKTTTVSFLTLHLSFVHFLRSSVKVVHLIIVEIGLMTLFSFGVQLLFSVEWDVLFVLNETSKIVNSQIGQLLFNSFLDRNWLPPYLCFQLFQQTFNCFLFSLSYFVLLFFELVHHEHILKYRNRLKWVRFE